ncbi:MAG: DNA phosphorothioation-dependent restriction protein DptF [Clostridia bacterium]|nr:DNA phosphorothioation-dependent restriction protein DptF [Clostridia bacterium]
MACEFITQLSKLRKLSAESVDNTKAFDEYKQYLHVERPVEEELRELLRQINVNQRKCLVLLCGSAGDGKSHLISYLKNSDPEGLLADYETYNDATESSKPTSTSIDTLSEKLSSFNDDNYLVEDDRKVIVAINLGTLNNFIESDKGKLFSKLKEYVVENRIFSGFNQQNTYTNDSIFQHVSFSDYQVFALKENGVEPVFLEKLLDKIFRKMPDNLFYQAYVEDANCPMCSRCPVRHNYEFLSDVRNQKALIRRIVEVVIKDKEIVSTREVLNLLFDLIVHPNFDKDAISAGTSDTKYLMDYINWTTPMLIDEFEDISPLLNTIRKHDVLKSRSIELDNNATEFHSKENIDDVFVEATVGTPYQILRDLTDVSVLGGTKKELKTIMYRFIARLKAFREEDNIEGRSRLDDFMRCLYFQNCGDEKKLQDLYTATKKAIMSWDGQFDDDYICVDDTNENMWVVEQLYLKPYIPKKTAPVMGSIQRFSPTVTLRFQKEGDASNVAEICIDYALYELISDMREGYRPTVQDKNRHADFAGFVQRLGEFGNKSKRIVLIPKRSDESQRIVFEEADFDEFKFKVVLV